MLESRSICEGFIVMLILLTLPSTILAINIQRMPTKNEIEEYTLRMSGAARRGSALKYVKYMVSIRSRHPQRYFGDNHFCGGVLISKTAVLTAAHCIMDKRQVLTRPRRLIVVAGCFNRLKYDKHTVLYSVASTAAYEVFFMNGTHDIGIIKLGREIPKNNPAIDVMPLPKTAPKYGSDCIVIGWGRLYFRGPLSAIPMHITVKLLTPNVCKEKVKIFMLDHGMLCAADEVYTYEDPCRGDSGGPIICNGQLTGIISWTVGCGQRASPSLYTDVFYHLKWINETLAGNDIRMCYLLFLIVLLQFVV